MSATGVPHVAAAGSVHRRAVFAVALGGALGAPARYEIGLRVHTAGGSFPWATFWINVSGAFALGLFATLLVERFTSSRYPRPFFAVGFLGAYTTYSTLAVDTVVLMQHHHVMLGALDLVSSVAAGIAAVYAGMITARALPGGGPARVTSRAR